MKMEAQKPSNFEIYRYIVIRGIVVGTVFTCFIELLGILTMYTNIKDSDKLFVHKVLGYTPIGMLIYIAISILLYFSFKYSKHNK